GGVGECLRGWRAPLYLVSVQKRPGKTIKWPGQPRLSLKSASASRSRRRDDRERNRCQDWPPHGASAHRRAGWFPCRTRRRYGATPLRARHNTNPILIEGSPERVEVERKDWEVAEDGMEIVL